MSQLKGSLLAIGSGLTYGFLGYFGINLLLLGHSIENMLIWRFFFSIVFILLALIMSEKKQHFLFKEACKSLLAGAIGYAPGAILYFKAAADIGSGLAMAIFFCYPVFVVLAEHIVLKKWVDRYTALSLFFIILGIAMLVDLDWSKSAANGVLVALFSSLAYSSYILVSHSINLTPLLNTLFVSLGCVISCSLVHVFFYNQSIIAPYLIEECLYLIGAGVISTALPIVMFLQSLKYISMEKASILSVLEPVFVLLIGVCVLGESLSRSQGVGTLFILTGALVTLSNPLKKKT